MNEESTETPGETMQNAPTVSSTEPPRDTGGTSEWGVAGGEQPANKKTSPLVWVALGVAIFGLLIALIPFATFGSGLFILAGIILSLVAIAKSHTGGKGAAITALVLSLVAVPVAITMSIISVTILGTAGTALNSALIEQQIASGISEQLGIESTVICPDAMVGSEGTTFECQATDTNGDSVIVDITVVDSLGDIIWEIRS